MAAVRRAGMTYFCGRFFQLTGLLTLPASMWIAEFEKNESLSISIFVASIVIFFIGYLLTRFSESNH